MNKSFHTDGATVPLIAGKPLLIVDADEVLLAFAKGFERFLSEHGLYLDLASYRLHGNVRRRDDGSHLMDIEVNDLLHEFRADLDWLEPVPGARETMVELSALMSVVVLSNVSITQAPARIRNFATLDWDFPLLANSGAKGPAVRTLAKRAKAPTFFLDDTPMHHESVANLAPNVHRIHFVSDERLRPLMPTSQHAHYRAENWREIAEFVRARLGSD